MNLRSSFSSVATHSVFLATNGKLYSWGPNWRHCLGHGDSARFYDKPKEMTTPQLYEDGGFKDFAAGEHHNLILTNKSRIFVWGRNEDNQLGGGSKKDIVTPRLIQEFPDDQIPTRVFSGGHFSVVLTEDGSVYTMGFNNSGQLGNGHRRGHNKIPHKVHIPEPVTDLTCGWSFCLALTKSGQYYGWGYNTSYQLRIKELIVCVPELSSLSGFTRMRGATNHALGIQEGGGLMTWGRNLCDQVEAMKPENWEPCLLFAQGCRDIACGYSVSFVLKEDGSLLSWGNNKSGVLGYGDSENGSDIPKKVQIPEHSAPIAFFGTAASHAFFISEEGDLYLWGSGDDGKLGMGSPKTPKLVPTLLPNWKWELPPSWAKWNSVFRWLFLGKLDENSAFKNLHVEIIFNLVTIWK
jgi:alpha-tubulin suppressor-like RCC1 family protein